MSKLKVRDAGSGNAHRAGAQQPLLLSVRQVSELLALSPRTVWRLASAGHLPQPTRIGRAARWRRRDVERFLGSLKPGVAIEVPRDSG